MNVHIWCTLHSTSQGAELKRGIACFQRNIFLSFYRSISAFNFFWWGQVGRVAKKNPPPNIPSCFLLPWRFWNYVFLPCLIPLVWWHITFTFSKLVYFLQTCLLAINLLPFCSGGSQISISPFIEKKFRSPDIWCWQISKYTASSKLAAQQWTFTHIMCCRQILSFKQIQKYRKLQIQMPLLLPDLSASNEPPPHLLPTQPLFPGGRHLAHSCQHKNMKAIDIRVWHIGFQTFANFWRVSVLVSKPLVWGARSLIDTEKVVFANVSRYPSKFWPRHTVIDMTVSR